MEKARGGARWRRQGARLISLEGDVERLDELPHAAEHDVARAGEGGEDLGAAEAEGEAEPGGVRGEAGDGRGGGGGGEDGAAEEEAESLGDELEAPAGERGGAHVGAAIQCFLFGGGIASLLKMDRGVSSVALRSLEW